MSVGPSFHPLSGFSPEKVLSLPRLTSSPPSRNLLPLAPRQTATVLPACIAPLALSECSHVRPLHGPFGRVHHKDRVSPQKIQHPKAITLASGIISPMSRWMEMIPRVCILARSSAACAQVTGKPSLPFLTSRLRPGLSPADAPDG